MIAICECLNSLAKYRRIEPLPFYRQDIATGVGLPDKFYFFIFTHVAG